MRRFFPSVILFFCLFGSTVAHETLLRPPSHNLDVGDFIRIAVFVGNFDRSVYAIGEDRVVQLNLHTDNGHSAIPTKGWELVHSGTKLWETRQRVAAKLGGTDLRDSASFPFTVKKEGTHVIGLECLSSRVALELPKFQKYLDTEAYKDVDMAALGFTEDSDIVLEKFQKLAKTIIQVGDSVTDNVTQPIGLSVEIVPMSNPSRLKKGDKLDLKILHQGNPLEGQSVVVGWKPGAFKQSMDTVVVYKTDVDGIVTIPLDRTGIWWANFILLEPTEEHEELDFESLWSSLTFQIQ